MAVLALFENRPKKAQKQPFQACKIFTTLKKLGTLNFFEPKSSVSMSFRCSEDVVSSFRAIRSR
jgi:hypothetical protein